MSAAAQLEQDNILRVDYGRGSETAVFALYPLSRRHLLRLAPDIPLLSRVCLDRESPSDLQQLASPLLELVVQLLTGSSLDRLRALGVRAFTFNDVRPAHQPVVARLDLGSDPASPSTRSSTRQATRSTGQRARSGSSDPART